MRILITFVILAFVTAVSGQVSNPDDTTGLSVVKLKYRVLDSNTVRNISYPLTNSKYSNILSYSDKGKIRLAYFTNDKNKWTSIALPFSEVTNDFKLISPASGSETLLMVRGIKNSTENHGRSVHRTNNYSMLIIKADGAPVQIFKVSYGCDETEIPNDGENESVYDYQSYKRTIEVTEKGITITSPDHVMSIPCSCPLTAIKDGTYIFTGVGVQKEK
ncbi:MAG TPA: hypothetical protein PKW80_04800 [Bacteroidales bacterium]|nr:hypothetical protein [Bacteroidales bacterium]